MQVTSATIAALQTTVNMTYKQAYESTEVWYTKLSTTIPSSTLIGTYAWMARLPRMREWLGPRILNNIFNHEYTLKNKDWEDTVSVDRNEMEDDMLGVFTGMVVPELGRQAKQLPQTEIAAVIEDTTTTTFDGLTFFNASHTLDPAGVQSNLITTNPLTLANYETSYSAMTALKGEDGLPLQLRPTILLVPPRLEITARRIISAGLVADPGGVAAGVENVMKGSAEIVVGYELTSDDTWYLLDASKAIKPFIWQNRKSPVLTSLINLSDPNVFASRQFIWGVDARGAAGYSLWFLAQKNTA